MPESAAGVPDSTGLVDNLRSPFIVPTGDGPKAN